MNAHEAMVQALSNTIGGFLHDSSKYTVVTNARWQPLDGFPSCVFSFDVMVLGNGAKWRTDDAGAILCPEAKVGTAIDVIEQRTLKRDLHDKQDLFGRSGMYEYAVYDPTGEVLRPSLQVFRHRDTGTYQVATALNGEFFTAFGLRLSFNGSELWFLPCGPAHLEEELHLLRFPLLGGFDAWDINPEREARARQLEAQVATAQERDRE